VKVYDFELCPKSTPIEDQPTSSARVRQSGVRGWTIQTIERCCKMLGALSRNFLPHQLMPMSDARGAWSIALVSICIRLLIATMSIVGWVIILMGAFVIGVGTLPVFYLLLTGRVQTGDMLPDGNVLPVAAYLRLLALEIGFIAFGVLIKDFARIVLFIKRRFALNSSGRT